MKNKQLIVINAGSSSIKFAAFDVDADLKRNIYGTVENIKTAPILKIKDNQGKIIQQQEFTEAHDYTFFYEYLFSYFASIQVRVHAVGHRVVHGGAKYHTPVLINENILQDLKDLIPFAPLHQPYNIEGIEVIAKLHPEIPQVACFDTAFHRTHLPVADKFALPRKFDEEGIRRYGFHGLSYEYILHKIQSLEPQKANARIIVAHLGNGASMCAMKNGKSIDSTMGFTALDGLMMGSRCGNIDPGVILYLMQSKKMGYKEIEKLLYYESGLLGVSGISNNMQVLLETPRSAAEEAIALFVYRAQKEIGALAATLNGLDLLVFTGGIGENAPEIRKRICQNMDWMGLQTDITQNEKNMPIISMPESAVEIRVIPTNEEWVIANHTLQKTQ